MLEVGVSAGRLLAKATTDKELVSAWTDGGGTTESHPTILFSSLTWAVYAATPLGVKESHVR